MFNLLLFIWKTINPLAINQLASPLLASSYNVVPSFWFTSETPPAPSGSSDYAKNTAIHGRNFRESTFLPFSHIQNKPRWCVSQSASVTANVTLRCCCSGPGNKLWIREVCFSAISSSLWYLFTRIYSQLEHATPFLWKDSDVCM